MLRIMVGSLLVTFMLSLPSLHAETGSDPAGQDPWTLEEIVTALADEPHLVLGVLDGPDCEVFGRITGYRRSPEGMHYGLSAIELAASAVLLQSGGLVDGGMFRGVNSALLDVEAGALRPVDHRLPHVFAARGRWLLAAHHDEFPRVGIWTRPDERAW